ncbi:MAG: leucine--tRNA ligase [Puniceicoccales bacterium]|jgi:leucyl-tRNA synthetase|nr:leucine--tRNA ligase [Puniceicoccales bacterium]
MLAVYSQCKQYDFDEIELFWQKFWDKNKTFCVQEDFSKEKYYVLDMFPYPSGAGLHIGHPEGYTASDILTRYKHAKGYNVLHPMGWDAFGLPAEQHAIKTGINPAINTANNIEIFKKQMKRIGFAIDWDREVNTTDPGYFKWTQWIFLQLFKHGLAYVDESPVWWCEELKSVLANEEVIGGRSERGDFPVIRKNLCQWILRITRYADKLLEGLFDIDWPDSTKRQQTAWIGKSEGANIRFKIDGYDEEICVYTTRPDTIFGATFLVIAPEHPLVEKIVAQKFVNDVKKYVEDSRKKSDLERTDLAKTKTGVQTGAYAINPANGERIEIWIADYVLVSYGSGAIMAVPGHDKRDYDFALNYGIAITQVISDVSGNNQLPYVGDGILVNSGEFNGISSEKAREKIISWLHAAKRADFAQNYKLRDWLFSRQRYWGEPIPIIWIKESDYQMALSNDKFYFKEFLPKEPVSYNKGGVPYCALPLCLDHLPLTLPPTDNYLPSTDGESPLVKIKSWVNVYVNIETGQIVSAEDFNEKNASFPWVLGRRETNTMPQWAGSCWYYLRYLSPHCETNIVDPKAINYWQTPDFYIGGAEHAVLHLLYARFWHRFLFDIGAINTGKEPFRRLFHQGIILGEDGTKMSKSRGNVINPDEIVKHYGADALRLYEMFLGPLDMMKPWSTKGIEGVSRFLKKVWNGYVDKNGNIKSFQNSVSDTCRTVINETIRKVGNDIEELKFNTAISQMMICLNSVQKAGGFDGASARNFLKILAPFAPHISEELWARIGNNGSIYNTDWPEYDDSKMIPTSQKIIVQVNGKMRAELVVSDINNMQADAIFELAMHDGNVQKYIFDKKIVKKIYIRGKIVNFVVE